MVVQALGRLREHEFEANLDYIERPCLMKQNKQKCLLIWPPSDFFCLWYEERRSLPFLSFAVSLVIGICLCP